MSVIAGQEYVMEEHEAASTKTLGFWVYLMTDCVLFASLFATYIVLRESTYGGPGGQELFEMPFVLTETLLLLTSSFTCGLALLAARSGRVKQAIFGLGATFVLGAAFLTLELSEFVKFASEGHTWQGSAFLSAFFTLVGTHGLHIAAGLIWALVMVAQLLRQGLTAGTLRRMGMFGLFWHFLDIIWIFIFTIVYLMGVI